MRQRTGASIIDSGRAGLRVALSESRDHYFPLLGRPSRRSRGGGYIRRLGLVWRRIKGRRLKLKIKVRREVREKDERKSNELEGSVRRDRAKTSWDWIGLSLASGGELDWFAWGGVGASKQRSPGATGVSTVCILANDTVHGSIHYKACHRQVSCLVEAPSPAKGDRALGYRHSNGGT